MLLLWTVMLSARTAAQSGDTDLGMVPTLHCLSHISLFEGTNISCSLVSSSDSQEDDEDEDSDSIESITACCCSELGNDRKKCVKAFGDTVSSKDLNSVSPVTLTAESRTGHLLKTKLDLRKIIKPKSPWVYNVTFPDNALVHVQTPYKNDYLNEENQLFQIQLWSEKTNLTQNTTSVSMNIDWSHLSRGTQYYVKVRAAPRGYFRGTWSEWSETYSFKTPSADKSSTENISSLWSLVLVVVLVVGSFMLKTRACMCPSIPQPKETIMQICRPSNGLPLIFKPDESSSLNVYSIVNTSTKPSCNEKESVLSSAGPPQSKAQTPPEVQPLQQPDPTQETSSGDPHSTQPEREDSYVTMSGFYQIKTGAGHTTFATSRSAT
ncbi:unnamed protein product [Knipowitschia caucasica]|uniref:Fibronectin type-III domain-containing protein n=1 Tax=Knipowitschia caucasica TaxID=637954 RepID=A0AAV2IT24_KNICA